MLWLDALTEAVVDVQNFRNLLDLFLCSKLGPEQIPNANLG